MKKGFTLVELMAIIVLLAVVMAMIVPTIIGVIESSKKDAFMSDVKSIIREINNELASGTYYDITQLNVDDLKNVFQIDTKNIYFISADEADGEITYSVIGANEWEGYLAQGTYDQLEVIEATTPPTIALHGSSTVIMEVGQTYVEAGATAQDSLGFNLASRITISGTVNNAVAGTYVLTYSVEDYSGNVASVTRTISVYASAVPTVVFGTNGNNTYAKTRSTTVTVSDNVALNPSSLEYQWTTSTTAPTEASFTTAFTNGATLSTPPGVTGGYYLWILAQDLASNKMIARSNVFNLDNTAPLITMSGSSPVRIVENGTYTDLGATATDGIDGNLTSNVIVNNSVNTALAGVYNVTYQVSDSSGNAATQVIRTVYVDLLRDFSYTGSVQTLSIPVTGIYNLKVWGAQGGNGYYNAGGKGGYASGDLTLTAGTTLYIYVGGQGQIASVAGTIAGGFNGGGSASGSTTINYQPGTGGGGTDIRVLSDTINNRIIVAGGGGGGASSTSEEVRLGGAGGGTDGIRVANGSGYGGTQTAAGQSGGTFYQGGSATSTRFASGGGGWFGGGYSTSGDYGGGGGSGYVLTNTSAIPSGYFGNYASYYMTNTTLTAGNSSFPATGGGVETGHSGNGYARVSFVSQ